MTESPEVLFIGTGIMGALMTLNLHAGDVRVVAWNRSVERLAPLAAKGIRTIGGFLELQRARRVAIVMVSTGAAADEVLFGSAAQPGAARVLEPGSTVIVMSSIPVETAVAQAARLRSMGIDYLDAPVSGGEIAARNGTLKIMAGGDQDVLDRVRSLLSCLGSTIRVGPVGCGSLAKLANQTIVGICIGAVAEALVLAELGGADPAAVRNAIMDGFADSRILRLHGERMLTRQFQPGGHCTTQLKDLETALAFARSHAGAFPLLERMTELYRSLCNSPERAALDHSAMYLDCRDRAGLPQRR